MDGRHALTMACSSGHPSQTDNYLDTHAPQKTFLLRAAARKDERGSFGPSTSPSAKAMSTIKIFSMLD